MGQQAAKMLILAGIVLAVVGVIFYFFGGKLNFLGKLPGDIRIERENFKFYFPVTTCVLISLIATALIKIVQWFMHR